MGTLRQENKIYLFIYLFISSCENKQEKNKSYFEISKKAATIEQYNLIYQNARDSISNWVGNNIVRYQMQKYSNWQLDSLICFNSEANKCVMAIINQQSKTVTNSLNYFYGVKINGKWYFFEGPVVYLFSDHYGKLPKTALSFSTMQDIALKEIYAGYLTNNGKINEAWFDYIFKTDIGCSSCKTDADFNTYYLWLVNNNWKKHPDNKYTPENKPLP
jgi:hypothetical protein